MHGPSCSGSCRDKEEQEEAEKIQLIHTSKHHQTTLKLKRGKHGETPSEQLRFQTSVIAALPCSQSLLAQCCSFAVWLCLAARRAQAAQHRATCSQGCKPSAKLPEVRQACIGGSSIQGNALEMPGDSWAVNSLLKALPRAPWNHWKESQWHQGRNLCFIAEGSGRLGRKRKKKNDCSKSLFFP